ncbi:MarR family winged helix-turn-helix transcriptional regulator [Reinekea marinisedimentorum]|uniref:MarR family 2-MHQ and catechol resistance regulon transcriptional repressor n=1 Tax=Reinekea marinisedimentorum TaxID=230495 RepID=A0A4R3I344_9GAMM|nr:MarR family transcriptional regulator [Reinekea marinisedimentorum]TCS40208.1 MarR family 2-MHQ and catechol resistance regulon transcriptional repressor [Reinekea marinisedimentorum]
MIDSDSDDILLTFQIPHHFIHLLMHDHVVPDELGINKTEVRTLMAIRREGPVSMRTIGSRVGIAKGSLTSVVDKLIKLELVQRSEHPEDRRKVLVSITEKGQQVAIREDKELRAHLGRKFSVLEDEEREALFQSLSTIQKITKRLKGAK